MAQIKVTNLKKMFGDFTAVRESSFTVEDGEFFVMLGPSGCGKTTTLRMIAGLEIPTSGEILLGGKDVTFARARDRDIAFVFQLFALYPHMNVRKNMAFPLLSMGMSRADIRTRVEETARLLQIDHILDKSVSGLAGGDRQRVALGRAIVRRPDCFLMDEPLGTLDTEFRDVMTEELIKLHDRIDATTVYVTHDQLEAMTMADKIAVMNNGVIEQFGTPKEIYDRPATMFVADFIGSPPMNFLPVAGGLAPGASQVRHGDIVLPVAALREGVSGDAMLGVRPEQIMLDDAASLRATVESSEYMGTNQIVTLSLADGTRLRAKVPSSQLAEADSQVGLSITTDRLTVFDVASGLAVRSQLHDLRQEAA